MNGDFTTDTKTKLLLALLLLTPCACAKKDQVVLFATARTQGRLWAAPPEGSAGGALTGGFAVFKNLYAREPLPKLAVDGGNWSAATPEGYLTRGRSTIACMSAVPYGLAAAGMEDLTLSPKELEHLSATSGFPLLGSNLYFKTNAKPPFMASQKVLTAGGHKIGFFSIMLPDPAKPNRQKNLANYKLEKETYDSELAIRAVRAEGAKVVVMLLGVNPKTHAEPSYYRDFIAKVPRVDLIITDDPAVKKPFRAGKAWVVRAGLEMTEAARITLDLEPVTGKLAGVSWKAIKLDAAKLGQDPGVLKISDSYRAASDAHFAKSVGTLKTAKPLALKGGSPIGDFAADCAKTWARTTAALIPASEPAAGFSSGTVTVADLYRAFPLDSSVVFVKIRGDDLENALSAMQPGEVSVSGLTLFMKDGALEHVGTAAGPLVPGKIYQIAVPDSLVGSGDKSLLSNAAEFANSRRYLREVIGWCITSRRVVESEEPRVVYSGSVQK